MGIKFSDEWGEFEIRVNDPRGQYWLYRDASRTLNIGWSHENPSRGHVYLSNISAPSGQEGVVAPDQLARSIARFLGFMVKPGGGYSAVQLHMDGTGNSVRFDDLAIIDAYLARFGLTRLESSSPNEPVWTRASVLAALPPGPRHMH